MKVTKQYNFPLILFIMLRLYQAIICCHPKEYYANLQDWCSYFFFFEFLHNFWNFPKFDFFVMIVYGWSISGFFPETGSARGLTFHFGNTVLTCVQANMSNRK